MREKQRNPYIDLMRGIGIILMVAGHVDFGEGFDRFIHAFHMPLFFLVAGYLSKDKQTMDLVTVVKKNAKSLLIPYFAFGIMNATLHVALASSNSERVERAVESFSSLLWNNTEGLALADALWFLTAMFLLKLIWSLALIVAGSKWSKVLCLLIGIAATFHPMPSLPWSMSSAFVGLGFFVIGLAFSHVEQPIWESFAGLTRLKLLAIPALSAILAFASPYVNVRANEYPCPPLFWANALLCVFSLWLICRTACESPWTKLEQVDEYGTPLITRPALNVKAVYDEAFQRLQWIGESSMGYLVMNQVFIVLFDRIIRRLLGLVGITGVMGTFPVKLLTLALSLLALTGAIKLLELTPLHILIGKR